MKNKIILICYFKVIKVKLSVGINIRENFGTRSGNEERYGYKNEAPGQGLRQGGHRGSGLRDGSCMAE